MLAVPAGGEGAQDGEVFLGGFVSECLPVSGFVSALGFFYHFVPHVAACVPFGVQVLFGLLAGAEPVRVSDLHMNSIASDDVSPPYGPTATSLPPSAERHWKS